MGGILSSLGYTNPTVPIVRFLPYKDGANDDALAAKGVIYSRFIRDDGSPLHVLASHTQSDPTLGPGQNSGVRGSQFGQVWELVEQMIGAPPFAEEVVFCGI